MQIKQIALATLAVVAAAQAHAVTRVSGASASSIAYVEALATNASCPSNNVSIYKRGTSTTSLGNQFTVTCTTDFDATIPVTANELRVNMDFVGSVDGEEFDGGKAEGFALVLGAGRMIPGFEDGIIGKKAGESFDIEVTFPEDYQAEHLKGKAAKFAIKLNKVEKQELPELDAEFIKRFGVEDGSIESLKAEIRKNMERELNQALKNQVKEQILSGLLEQNQIDVPKAAVTREIEALRQQAMQRFGAANSKNVPQLPDELFQEQAERRVRVGLLLGEVIREQDIKADDARVKTLIESLATAYEDPSEVVDYYFQNERLLNNMRDLAVEDQAIEFLLSKAQVTEKATSFDEVINKPGAAA